MIRDFIQWMVEMVGTGVVSPKPGPDYQIWGTPGMPKAKKGQKVKVKKPAAKKKKKPVKKKK